MFKTFTLRTQLKNRGCYAEITLDYNRNDSVADLSITYNADPQWEYACKAGVKIFYDYFLRKTNSGLDIRIHSINWLPVDTNNLIVLFAVIQSLCEALNFEVKGLELDVIEERFVFPEKRSDW